MVAIATMYQDRAKVCELNAAESPALARRLGVRGTPTVLVFEDGNLIGRVAGWRPQSYYEEMIEAEFPLSENES
jgi:thioredoxin-like negative regulator of GroEL